MIDMPGASQHKGEHLQHAQPDWSEIFKPETPSKDVPHIAASASATGSTVGDVFLVGMGLGVVGCYYLPWLWRRYCIPRAQPIGPFVRRFGFDLSDSSGSNSGFGSNLPSPRGDANSPLRSPTADIPNSSYAGAESAGSPNLPHDSLEPFEFTAGNGSLSRGFTPTLSPRISTAADVFAVGPSTDAGASTGYAINFSPDAIRTGSGRAVLNLDENLAAASASV